MRLLTNGGESNFYYQAIFSALAVLLNPKGSNSGYSISEPTISLAAPLRTIDSLKIKFRNDFQSAIQIAHYCSETIILNMMYLLTETRLEVGTNATATLKIRRETSITIGCILYNLEGMTRFDVRITRVQPTQCSGIVKMNHELVILSDLDFN